MDKNAKINDVKVYLNERRNLIICLDFLEEDERGGSTLLLEAGRHDDMETLANLILCLDCRGGHVHELEGKDVRLIYKRLKLFAIGHPYEDKFIRIQKLDNNQFSLSEIRKQFDAN